VVPSGTASSKEEKVDKYLKTFLCGVPSGTYNPITSNLVGLAGKIH
jgi:hypothetical protein